MINKKDVNNLQGLMYLYALAKTGNKTAVSNELGVSIDTLNKYIADLEEKANTKLIFSNARGTQVNPEGKAILKLAAEIARNLHLFNTYTSDVKNYKGTVRLCTGGFAAEYVTSSAFREFTKMYPEINLELKNRPLVYDADLLEADVAFDFFLPNNKDVVLIKTQPVKFGLFASPQYFEEYGQPKNMDDLLKNHRFCVQSGYFENIPEVVNLMQNLQHISFISDSVTALRTMLNNGLGIGICPVSGGLDNLVRLEYLDFEFSSDVYLFAHRNTKDIPRVSVFINYMKNVLERYYGNLPIAVACSAE